MPSQVVPSACWRYHLPGDVAPPPRSPEIWAWRAVLLHLLLVLSRPGVPPVPSHQVQRMLGRLRSISGWFWTREPSSRVLVGGFRRENLAVVRVGLVIFYSSRLRDFFFFQNLASVRNLGLLLLEAAT